MTLFQHQLRHTLLLVLLRTSDCTSLYNYSRRTVHTDHNRRTYGSYRASPSCCASHSCRGCCSALLGDADGLAHAVIVMTAVLPLLGDANGPSHAATAMTDTGTYILMATT
jgi:hypothetical protein